MTVFFLALPLMLGAGDVRADETGQQRVPVYFTSDWLEHDDLAQTVRATGHVEFASDDRLLKADQVDYDLKAEKVTARGNVMLVDQNGDVHFVDTLDLTRDLKDGYITALRSVLADGSRFTATTGTREDGQRIIMTEATYTPCEPCKLDPSRPPVWQLRADEVVHDTTDKTVTYKNAWMDMWGMPVAYTPYFSHSDGTVKQKSGFLAPTLDFDSQNGTSLGTRYYYGVAPDRDATVGLAAYTAQAPRLTGEYRQQFDTAQLIIDGSTTHAGYKKTMGDETVSVEDELRGHMRGSFAWDMTDAWRSGLDMNMATDDQYFKQYDIVTGNYVENRIYAERFSGRDYALVEGVSFQDLRTSDLSGDQPNILPDAQARFLGDPGQVLGGRWRVDASALGLERGNGGADMVRTSAELGWDTRHITTGGIVSSVNLSGRADQYYAVNRGASEDSIDKTVTRFVPVANGMISYPLVKRVNVVDVLFEPIAALTLTAKQSNNAGIPNEDSQDIQLDTSNLFESNRFPGLDRVEDLSRITYGGRTSINWDDGSMAELFLGQSYRFEEDDEDDLFSVNSGLNGQTSDYVGRLRLQYQERATFDYNFQLGSEKLDGIRHEIDSNFYFGPVTLNTRYLYAKTIDGIGTEETREQIQQAAAYKFYDDWQIRGGAIYDLGLETGLRRATLGLDYLGQCLVLSATGERKLIDETTGASATELMLRIGFKNLATFETSGIGLTSETSDSSDSSTLLDQGGIQ